MIRRQTVWSNDRGAIQVSVAVLDNNWDPLMVWTEELGPFDSLADVTGRIDQGLADWLRSTGIQQALL